MSLKNKNDKRIKKNIKKFFMISFVLFFLIGLYFILKYFGFLKKLNNLQEIKSLIRSAGFWSYSVFAVLQFLQVTLIPLPASITTIAGVIIFGPLIAFLISTLSIILGSIFAYFCGKIFKSKVLKNNNNKLKEYSSIGNFIFFVMMLFPFFPDDILCLMAGLTNMDFKFFLLTNLITRPLGLFCLCFFSSGKIIPFSSWGIAVWIIIAVLFVFFAIIYVVNKKKINNYFKNLIKKISNKNTIKN